MSAIEERRQRAREAFWDGAADESSLSGGHPFLNALGTCVETATRVKLTDEVMWAAGVHGATPAAIRAAFAAAGFEVIE